MEALKKYGPYVVLILPALVFVAAGIGKLMGAPELHQSFAMMGLPGWFGYFIGAAELAGAIGLFLPRTRKLAAAGLAVIMVGAVYFHVAYAVPSAIPSAVLLILMLVVMWLKWQPLTPSSG